MTDIVHVGVQHFLQHVAVTDEVVGDLHALVGGQLGADQILQSLLELGVACVAQLHDEAHHGGLGYADLGPQLGGGHVGGLVVVGKKIAGDLALALGKAIHILFDIAEDIAFHGLFSVLFDL